LKIEFFNRSVISPFAVKLIYCHFVLIAQRKISVLATPVTSSNLRNQAPLFTELRLVQATLFYPLLNAGWLNKLAVSVLP